MRKIQRAGLLLVAGFLVASIAAAAQRPLELSVLVAPAGSYSEVEGFEIDSTAYGVGAGWWVSDRWSLELRGLASDDESRFVEYEQETFELGLRRAFGGGGGWRPFLQAGARYRSSEARHEVVCQGPPGARSRRATTAASSSLPRPGRPKNARRPATKSAP